MDRREFLKTVAQGAAREILEAFAAASKPYGTSIALEDGVGRVVLGEKA